MTTLENLINGLPMTYFDRVEDGTTNKNVWIPGPISSFIRMQWALDNRPALNKARVTDIVQGLVEKGYWVVINKLESEGKGTVIFDMTHTRDIDKGDAQQYAVRMGRECHKLLASTVNLVGLGEIEYAGADNFNMSDAMINLLMWGVMDVIDDFKRKKQNSQ